MLSTPQYYTQLCAQFLLSYPDYYGFKISFEISSVCYFVLHMFLKGYPLGAKTAPKN